MVRVALLSKLACAGPSVLGSMLVPVLVVPPMQDSVQSSVLSLGLESLLVSGVVSVLTAVVGSRLESLVVGLSVVGSAWSDCRSC